MTWRAGTVAELADALRLTIPDRAFIAAVAADEDGYAVSLSDDCPLDGRFEIGSITKTMTGMILAALVNEHIVSLDDEIGHWINAGSRSHITLAQLATHTSGLPRLSPSHKSGVPDPYAFLTAKVAERELRVAPVSTPADWDYSNFGFQVLGLALERAADVPFAALLDQHVLGPLGMTCSGLPGLGGGFVVQGHAKGNPVAKWTHHLYGAGGVEVSAEDMARYLAACLAPPRSRAGRAIRLAQRAHHQIDPLRSAGLGWSLGPPGYLGHDGGTSGFQAMVGLRPPAHRAAAVLVSDRGARGLGRAVLRVLQREKEGA